MSTDIKRLCSKIVEKRKNDKSIAESEERLDQSFDFRKRIAFTVSYTERSPGLFPMIGYHGMPTIDLDEDDLDYLYKKYSKKLKLELNDTIKKLEKEYNKLI